MPPSLISFSFLLKYPLWKKLSLTSLPSHVKRPAVFLCPMTPHYFSSSLIYICSLNVCLPCQKVNSKGGRDFDLPFTAYPQSPEQCLA